MYMKHLLVARRHDDKQSMVIFIYFYLDETDACLGVLGTLVYWDVLLQGEDPCIHVESAPRCLCFLTSLFCSSTAPWTLGDGGNSCMNASPPTGFTGKPHL